MPKKAKVLGVVGAVLGIVASSLTIWVVLLRNGGEGDGGSNNDERSKQVQILSFSAQPANIQPGHLTTLKWSVRDGEQATIQPGLGNVALTGQQQVRPNQTTIYSLTASGGGKTSNAKTTVTVLLKSLVEQFSKGTMTGDAIDHIRISKIEGLRITFEVDYRINPAHGLCYVAGVFVNNGKKLGANYTISSLQGSSGTGQVTLSMNSHTQVTTAVLYLFESGKPSDPFIAKETPCRHYLR